MKPVLRIVVVVALAALVLTAWTSVQAAGNSLSEDDLAKLAKLQIADDAIVAKIQKDGVGFKLDDQTRSRLKEAGASDRVLAAVEEASRSMTAQPHEKSSMPIMVWVERQYGHIENPLHSEFSINGKTIDIFTSDTRKDIGRHLNKGWNTITIKTTPQAPATNSNELIFRIGPVHKDPKSDKLVMSPVFWKFFNGTDWDLKEGRFSHRLGPGTKDVTLTYRVHFSGLDHEREAMEEGDYVLRGAPAYGHTGTPVTGTVFVNGTPLNSFAGEERQVVITPLLKEGKNEIKLVSDRVKDVMQNNDMTIEVVGPLHFNRERQKFEGKPIAQMKAMQGWDRERATGQLVSQTDAQAASIQRTVPFFLDEAPAVARRRSEAGQR